MEILKKHLKEKLIVEIEAKRELIELEELIDSDFEEKEIIEKFMSNTVQKNNFNMVIFSKLVKKLIDKKCYDIEFGMYCEKFIIRNHLVMECLYEYLMKLYIEKNMNTENSREAIKLISQYYSNNTVNKLIIKNQLIDFNIDSRFIEAYIEYSKTNMEDILIKDSFRKIVSKVEDIPEQLIEIFFHIYVHNGFEDYTILEKLLYNSLVYDRELFKEIVFTKGDEYIDYCNEDRNFTKERLLILLEMHPYHKTCDETLLMEFLKYEIVDRTEGFEGAFDGNGNEVVSMYQRDRKLYFKIGFKDELWIKENGETRIINRDIINKYFKSVLINLYRTSTDVEFKRFCCERYIYDEVFNEKLLKDYIDLNNAKKDYVIKSYEMLLKEYFGHTDKYLSNLKVYMNKYIDKLRESEGKDYKDYVNIYISRLISQGNIAKAKEIVCCINEEYISRYMTLINSILFKAIETKETDDIMYMFKILINIDCEQLQLRSIQNLFVKYLYEEKHIPSSYNELIIKFYIECNDGNKRELMNTLLKKEIEEMDLLIQMYEIKPFKKLERYFISLFLKDKYIFPIHIQKDFIEKNLKSLENIQELSAHISDNEELQEYIYLILQKEYSNENRELIKEILKNIIRYENARLSWIKLDGIVVGRYCLGEIILSNRYLTLRKCEDVFHKEEKLVLNFKDNYKTVLQKFILNEEVRFREESGQYLFHEKDIEKKEYILNDCNIERVIEMLVNLLKIQEAWGQDGVYLYNPKIEDMLITKTSLIPISNFIIRGEGNFVKTRELHELYNILDRRISRKDIYEEAVLCEVYINFINSVIDWWKEERELKAHKDLRLVEKIKYIKGKLQEQEPDNVYKLINTLNSILDVFQNKELHRVSMADKVENFYVYDEEQQKYIYDEIVSKSLETPKTIEIIMDNIRLEWMNNSVLEFLINGFIGKLNQKENAINIFKIVKAIEEYYEQIEWDENISKKVERFLEESIQNEIVSKMLLKSIDV